MGHDLCQHESLQEGGMSLARRARHRAVRYTPRSTAHAPELRGAASIPCRSIEQFLNLKS